MRQCVVVFVKYHPIFPNSSSIPSICSRSAAQIISFLFLLYLVLIGVLWLSLLFYPESHPSAFFLTSSYSMPSISNRSVVVIDPYRSLYISFQPECLHVLLVHCNPFLMSFNLQGSRNVPCSFLSNGVFSTLFIFVVFFLSFVQPIKVLWFHSFVKEATLFYLFLFRFSPVPS